MSWHEYAPKAADNAMKEKITVIALSNAVIPGPPEKRTKGAITRNSISNSETTAVEVFDTCDASNIFDFT